MSNVLPNPSIPTPNPLGVPQMPAAGIQVPSFGGPVSPTVPMPTNAMPQGNITTTANGGKNTNNIYIIGYIAAQKNAVKRVVDESASRKSYKALYEALSEENKAQMTERQILNAEGENQTTKEGKPKTVSLTSTFSMTAFRTFFREDGKGADGGTVPGFNTISKRMTYQVDMSENSAEFWVVKYIAPANTENDYSISTALSSGHIHDYPNGLSCLKSKQFLRFAYALGKPNFQIISLKALQSAQATGTQPQPLGHLAYKPSKSQTKNKTTVTLGIYTPDYAKCSIRQLGLSDNDQRTDEVAYIVLRNNTSGQAMNLAAESVTNAKAFSLYFPKQNIAQLSTRKTFTKADYAQPGFTDDDINEAYKAAKHAEVLAYDTPETKAICEQWGITADKYNDLSTARPSKRSGMKPDDFKNMADQAMSAINAMLKPN